MRKRNFVLMPIMLMMLFSSGCQTETVITVDPPNTERVFCEIDLPTATDVVFEQELQSAANVEDKDVVESKVEEIVPTVTESITIILATESVEMTTAETEENSAEEAKTEESTTSILATNSPVMQTSATEMLTTEALTTEPPTTEAPTTEAPVPQSLSVKVRGEHYIGDTLSAGDFTVTVTMSDGSTKKNPAGWSADQLYLGDSQTVIIVSYQGLTAQVTVSASERPTEAPTTEVPTEAPTDTPVEVPVQPQLSLDRAGAEAAWSIQKGIIESQAFNLDTLGYTGKPIAWSERLYDLACQRAKEIVDNFSHDVFHSIDASAENIAKNVPSADMVINGWYNSPGHKDNMLSGWDYGAIAKYGNYWVALFSNRP